VGRSEVRLCSVLDIVGPWRLSDVAGISFSSRQKRMSSSDVPATRFPRGAGTRFQFIRDFSSGAAAKRGRVRPRVAFEYRAAGIARLSCRLLRIRKSSAT